MSRPLLFLDVDGPLNPYAAPGGTRPEGYVTVGVPEAGGEWGRRVRPLQVWLRPGDGAALLGLGHFVDGGGQSVDRAGAGVAGAAVRRLRGGVVPGAAGRVHWKCEPLVRYAAGRPFAWVDDEQGAADHACVAAEHGGRALLHHVNPRAGLREADFAGLAGFARSLGAGGGGWGVRGRG